jgi:hypothetical protein
VLFTSEEAPLYIHDEDETVLLLVELTKVYGTDFLQDPEAVVLLCLCLEVIEGPELVLHGFTALSEQNCLDGGQVPLESSLPFDELTELLVPNGFLDGRCVGIEFCGDLELRFLHLVGDRKVTSSANFKFFFTYASRASRVFVNCRRSVCSSKHSNTFAFIPPVSPLKLVRAGRCRPLPYPRPFPPQFCPPLPPCPPRPVVVVSPVVLLISVTPLTVVLATELLIASRGAGCQWAHVVWSLPGLYAVVRQEAYLYSWSFDKHFGHYGGFSFLLVPLGLVVPVCRLVQFVLNPKAVSL